MIADMVQEGAAGASVVERLKTTAKRHGANRRLLAAVASSRLA